VRSCGDAALSFTTAPLFTISVSGIGSSRRSAREMKTASRDQRHLDAARDDVDQRVAMRVGQPAAAVEQGAVYIYSDQSGWRTSAQNSSSTPTDGILGTMRS
jgi:hypothetical protein